MIDGLDSYVCFVDDSECLVLSVGIVVYYDISGLYIMNDIVLFFVGVNNLFDK